MFDLRSQDFRTRHGPVFANLVLADEINRAPAKTQAALLEVMQERQVTIDGETRVLPPPFMVFATQNPVEHEGTYPLPEAQLDRFLMKVWIDYPAADDEHEIVARAAGAGGVGLDRVARVCGTAEILRAQQAVAGVAADASVVRYAVQVVAATRESRAVGLGAGTRGAIGLVRAAKAFALLRSRDFVIPDDIKAAALPVLRHRVQLTPEMTIGGQGVDEVLAAIVEGVPAPRA
jgi:MoxR-like ATPase